MSPANVPVGEAAALGAAALWAGSTILWTRQMAVSYPQAMNLFKTSLCAPLFWILLVAAHPEAPLRGVGLGPALILVASGVVGMSLGDTAYFAALPRIGARRTMMLQTLAPLFAAALSLPFGQELPGAATAAGVGLVIAGIYMVLRERPVGMIQAGRTGTGLVFGIAAAFCQALGIVLTKAGIQGVSVLQVSAIRIVSGVAGILLIELLHGQLKGTVRHVLRPPALRRIVPASLMGSFLGFLLFQVAIRYASPAVTAALTGTSPLFVAPMSVFLLGESMRAGGWLGTILAVVGVALVMHG